MHPEGPATKLAHSNTRRPASICVNGVIRPPRARDVQCIWPGSWPRSLGASSPSGPPPAACGASGGSATGERSFGGDLGGRRFVVPETPLLKSFDEAVGAAADVLLHERARLAGATGTQGL